MIKPTCFVFFLFCTFVPPVHAFRAPENAQSNVVLPKISSSLPKAPAKTDKKGNAFSEITDKIAMSNRRQLGRHAVTHKRWGEDREKYWFNQNIHTLGNIGVRGALHAALAPLSTKMIDVLAYKGVDVRQHVAEALALKITRSKNKIVDLCCGVGISTRALGKAFPDAEVTGIDTSTQMISMANFLSSHLAMVKPLVQEKMPSACRFTFRQSNAEETMLPAASVDLVTVMYAFHEAPEVGRHRILEEARRLLAPGGTLAVIDISTDYKPSPSMLAGEPYVLEYQGRIEDQLKTFRGFVKYNYTPIVPNHVGMWVLERAYPY